MSTDQFGYCAFCGAMSVDVLEDLAKCLNCGYTWFFDEVTL